jgi:hypothetical protein
MPIRAHAAGGRVSPHLGPRPPAWPRDPCAAREGAEPPAAAGLPPVHRGGVPQRGGPVGLRAGGGAARVPSAWRSRAGLMGAPRRHRRTCRLPRRRGGRRCDRRAAARSGWRAEFGRPDDRPRRARSRAPDGSTNRRPILQGAADRRFTAARSTRGRRVVARSRAFPSDCEERCAARCSTRGRAGNGGCAIASRLGHNQGGDRGGPFRR